MAMLIGIESVGVVTEGKVELESDRRDIYANVLFAAVSSYLTEKAIKDEN